MTDGIPWSPLDAGDENRVALYVRGHLSGDTRRLPTSSSATT